ncbi:MAG: hypothetical protein NTZ33_13840 [Bacteroidetes bacterium]|nr:hypothetical protein [Bacteroidota bacterium]
MNNVKIKHSVFTLGDTAIVKLPLTAYERISNDKLQQVTLSEKIKAGQSIVIKLGYNGELVQEFVGFVNRVNLKAPLELECEDWIYPLKSINVTKSWGKASINEILKYLAELCKFTLSKDIPEISVINFVAHNKTALWVLQELKDKYGLTIYFNQDNTLYAGLAYTKNVGKTVKLVNGRNVIKADDLKWQNKEDVKLKIKAISMDRDGSKIEATIGDSSGEIRTLYFYDVHDKSQLEKLARTEIDRYKYDGYRGTINCFLKPYSEPGMAAELTDPLFPVRGGRYFIESTEVDFGMSGGRRKLTIGIKLN